MRVLLIRFLVFCLLAQLNLVCISNNAHAKNDKIATVWVKMDNGDYAKIKYNYIMGKVEYQKVSSKGKSAKRTLDSDEFQYIKLAFEYKYKIIFEYETKTKEIWYKNLPPNGSDLKIKIDNGFHIWPLTKDQDNQLSPSLSVKIKSLDFTDKCIPSRGNDIINCKKLLKKLNGILKKNNLGKLFIKSKQYPRYRQFNIDKDILLHESEFTKIDNNQLGSESFTDGKKLIRFMLSPDVCIPKWFSSSHLKDLKKLGVNVNRHSDKLHYYESYCVDFDDPAIIEDENMLVPITMSFRANGGFSLSWNENMMVFIERLEMTDDFESGFEEWQRLFDESIEDAKKDSNKKAEFYIWHRRNEEYTSYRGEYNANLYEKQIINWPKRATLRSSPYKLKDQVRNTKNLHLVMLTDKPNREHSELLGDFSTKRVTVSFIYIGECINQRAGRTKKYLKYYKKLESKYQSQNTKFYCLDPQETKHKKDLKKVLNGQNPRNY